MAVEIKMPQLSDTMSSGKILTWKKNEGDKISRGDILAEVETDKANLEIESFFQGTLLKVFVPAQQVAKVGELIAVIGEPGEAVNSASASANNTNSVPAATSPAISTTSNTLEATPPPSAAAPTPPPATPDERLKASPLAKKLASERNINLADISGSGPNGRITKRDIESAAQTGASYPHSAPTSRSASAPTPSPRPLPTAAASPGSSTPLSKMRETIARRMQQSVTEAPHFYSTVAINMENALALRESLKAREEYKGISVNHLVIKAAGFALTQEPRVNAAYRDGAVYQPEQINVGVITAIEDGLMIPVIRDVPALSLRDLVFETRAALDRVRAGRPSSTDLSGGTFSISNMGMFDVENFTAIINPGQGAVLAVAAVKDQAIVKGAAIVPGKIMKVTLSVDHRIIDGVMAARFLAAFKDALEQPAFMFI